MNSKTKLKVSTDAKVPTGTKMQTGTVTLNLLSWILVVLVLTAGILLIPKVNAVEAAVTESAEVNGYTWYYTVETINNTKVATNVYLKDVEIYDDVKIPASFKSSDGKEIFPVYSIGSPIGTGKDSFLQGNSSIWCATIDATECTSLKVINSNVCTGESTFVFKLPDSVKEFKTNAFSGANNCGVECSNPNIVFNGTASYSKSFKLFMPNLSSAMDTFGSEVCVQSSTKVYGKTYYEYSGPNTCKLNFTSGSKYKANLGSGLFNTYVYAVSDKNASKELQQATYCNIPTSDLYDFQGYYFGDVPQTEEEMKQKLPIFDANGVFNYQAFQAQCSPKAGDSSIVLTAKWTPKSFKAVLVCEGDESKSFTINYVYGNKISLPVDCPFNILGQTVEKWTCNGVEYNPGDNIPSETFGSTPPKFYPITRPNTYSIRYLSGNSSDDAHVIPEEHTFSNVEKFTLKKNVYEKPGYFFKGWTTLNPTYVPASDLKVMYYDEQEVPCLGGFQKDKEIVDLYAVWEIRSVDVSYVDETGVEVETQRVEYAGKDTGIHKDVYGKNDYDVDYYTDQNGKVYTEDGHVDALNYKQHEKVILTPTFKKSQYKIRIGTEEYSAYVADDFEIPEYTGYSQEGYCFAGWDVKTPLLKKGDQYLIPKSTQKKNSVIQLSPIWEKETYGIYYDTVVDDDAPRYYQIGDEVTLPTLYREGYKFLGWNNGSANITKVTGVGNLSLTAKWEEIRYSLYCPQQPAGLTINGIRIYSPDKASYDFAYCKKIDTIGIENDVNGKMMTGFTVTDDQDNVLYEYFCDPTKTIDCIMPDNIILDPSKTDMTLNIVYGNAEYTITYDVNGGVLPEDAPKSYISGKKVDLPKPSKENYEFLGWDDGNSNQIANISPDTVGDLSLTAIYGRKKCKVTLEYNGGTANDKISSISYIYEEGNFDLPKMSERSGYTFVGWYDEVLKRFVKTVNTSISTDRVIRAIWTKNSETKIDKITVNPVFYEDIEISHAALNDSEGFYYSQLSEYLKKIYTEVEAFYQKPENFYSEIAVRFSVESSLTKDDVELAMSALIAERPELFWIKCFDVSDISDGKICVTPRLAYNNVEAYADHNEFDANIQEFYGLDGDTSSEKLENLIAELKKRKAVISRNSDDTVNKLKSAAHLCVFREGTSESVAKLIRIVCRNWNIPCTINYEDDFCWHSVQVDGKWWYVNVADVLLNDAPVFQEDRSSSVKQSTLCYKDTKLKLSVPEIKQDAPAPSVSPVPTSAPNPSGTPVPTDIPVSTETPVPTGTPEPSGTPAPTDAPIPTGTPVPTGTPNPSGTTVPSEQPTFKPGENDKTDPAASRPVKNDAAITPALPTPSNTPKGSESDGTISIPTHLRLTVKVGGVTYTCRAWKKGFAVTKIKTKKSTITIPVTVKVKGKKYRILKFDKNVFKGCKKLKTVKLRAKISLAKGALKGLNAKAKVFVSKKYFKPMKKVLTSKKSGWKKSMKLKRG